MHGFAAVLPAAPRRPAASVLRPRRCAGAERQGGTVPAARSGRILARSPRQWRLDRPSSSRMPKTVKHKIEARLSPIHGNGVFAKEPIKKGERIVRYRGKLRTHEEVDEEYGGEDENGHTFLFTLNDDYVIDANVGGNIARWINHSCKPNCESEIEEDAKGRRHKDKVYIQAIRNIKPGEELTYNYGIVLDEPHTKKVKKLWACKCGAKNCTGTMLQPKR
jgi:SET domain-containing protein